MEKKSIMLILAIAVIAIVIIVILMLLTPMLFIRSTFGGQTRQMEEVRIDMEASLQRDLAQALEDRGLNIILASEDMQVQAGKESKNYIAMRQPEDLGSDSALCLALEDPSPLASSVCVLKEDISFITSNAVSSGETEVIPMTVTPGPDTKGTCMYAIIMSDCSSKRSLGSVQFVVTVEE